MNIYIKLLLLLIAVCVCVQLYDNYKWIMLSTSNLYRSTLYKPPSLDTSQDSSNVPSSSLQSQYLPFVPRYNIDTICKQHSITQRRQNWHLITIDFLNLCSYLNDCNVPYFAEGGTLLGTMRNKGFIEGDDDNDIAILDTELDSFITLINNTNYFYVYQTPHSNGQHDVTTGYDGTDYQYKTTLDKLDKKRNFDIWSVAIQDKVTDVFVYYKFLNSYFMTTTYWRNYGFGNHNFYAWDHSLFPLTTHPYYSIDINVPNNAIKHLLQQYGQHCLTHDEHGNRLTDMSPKRLLYI